MTKKFYFLFTMLLFAGFLYSCLEDKAGEGESETASFTYHEVEPAPFPSLDIPGFNFPEDSTTILNWVKSGDEDSIYLHGWGIWTGLTSLSTQTIPGDDNPLRVFETWMTPEEMIDEIKGGDSDYKSDTRSNRANLKTPNQFTHFTSGVQTVNDSIHESVSYSPAAAKFAIDNKIFLATTLYNYAKVDNRTEVPFFPNDAITIKPVFKILAASSGETKFNIAAWNGTTEKLDSFPEQDWESFVTVDISGEGDGAGTYGLDDFIHYKLNDEDIHYFEKEFTENSGNPFEAQPGDIAILVAMHVGSREITNWTWQTFWWDANADNPPLPSSKAIADMRPDELTGAARHYSMAVAYYMINPNEPYAGENVVGEPNYAFNPYLEAGFGVKVFDDGISHIVTPANDTIPTYVGVRTNCMSCHRMATIDPNTVFTSSPSNTPYVGNSYISRTNALFDGQLLLDFAWSIAGNVDTTGMATFMASIEE